MTTVLLVEDNVSLLESVATDLEMREYTVWQATNGEAALDHLQVAENVPDIIVSDIAMPDMDGFELLERVRANAQWENIPFLFLTAFNSNEYIRTSKQLGADDYLVKPFHAEDLVLAMENKLRRVRAIQRAAQIELDHARQELIQVMSHELRTPLTAIFGSTELLAESLAEVSDDFVHQLLQGIRQGAQRMNQITNNALILLQLDSGHARRIYQRTAEVYEMIEIVQGAQSAFKRSLERGVAFIPIVLGNEVQPAYVKGVRQYLLVIFTELLRNAHTFSPADGTIWVDVKTSGQQVAVAIRDEGIGIAPEYLGQVWERFKQIKRQQYEQQGLGLGLAVVYELVRLHGGSCTIDSEIGRGTCVTVYLPLDKAPE